MTFLGYQTRVTAVKGDHVTAAQSDIHNQIHLELSIYIYHIQ